MPSLYGGGGEAASEGASWRWEVQIVDKNIYVSREVRPARHHDLRPAVIRY